MHKYPLEVYPFEKKVIWGSESWILSDRQGSECVITNGENAGLPLSYVLREWGEEELPILIKIIDAKDDLSVQVHPDDAFAKALGQPRGKSEMWYVIDAKPEAFIYNGLIQDVSPQELEERILNGSLPEILHKYTVKPGNLFFIPAGTIHALGGGITVAEVQQSSDTTFRLYDYKRLTPEGVQRELHIKEALRCASLSAKTENPFIYAEGNSFFADMTHFRVTVLDTTDPVTISVDDSSFLSVSLLSGSCTVDGNAFTAGRSLYIPKGYGKISITGDARILMASV